MHVGSHEKPGGRKGSAGGARDGVEFAIEVAGGSKTSERSWLLDPGRPSFGGLVLGCIDAEFSKLPRSTQYILIYRSQTPNVQLKLVSKTSSTF